MYFIIYYIILSLQILYFTLLIFHKTFQQVESIKNKLATGNIKNKISIFSLHYIISYIIIKLMYSCEFRRIRDKPN